MDPVDFLLVAYKLSLLSFYIGVLVYTLPVPLPGLKRWAPTLISDSIVAAGLSFLFFHLFRLGEYIMGLLGGSWDFLFKWYHDSLATVISIKTLLVVIQAIPDPLGVIDAIRSLVSPVDKAVTGALLFLATIGGLIELVRNYAVVIAAIGIALYAVPFRLARGGGAWLLAFSLAFSIGLPLLPVFLVSIAESPGSPVNVPEELRMGIAVAEVTVEDSLGKTVKSGFVRIYNIPEGDLIALYKLESDGRLYTSYGDFRVTLPSRVEIAATLEIAGVTFPLNPSTINLEDYEYYNGAYHVRLTAPHVLYSEEEYMVLYTNGGPFNESLTGNRTLSGILYLEPGEYLAVSFPVECTVSLESPGLRYATRVIEWGGIEFNNTIGYAETAGWYNVSLRINECGMSEDPSINVMDYFTPSLDISFIDYNILASFILYYFTVPLMYLFLLFSVTTGVARFLGGRDRIQVRVV